MQSLAPYHSFGFSCCARAVISVSQTKDLPKELKKLGETGFFILGEGSNTAFLEDYSGVIINPRFKGIELEHRDTHYLLKVGAGENWHRLVVWCMQRKIYGLENLALIPGSMGAAPIQNIGAYGVEIEKFIHQVNYYDIYENRHKSLEKSECQFAYRDSVFKHQLAGRVVITSVELTIPKNWQGVTHYGEIKELSVPTASDIFDKVVSVRQSKLPDPAKIGNAGSFFKNPIVSMDLFCELKQRWSDMPHYPVNERAVKVPAAWLIDQLGFKGKKIGGVACHPKQALVLTNDGSGTGQQLLQLARDIKNAVLNEFSISLNNEVRLIGQNGQVPL